MMQDPFADLIPGAPSGPVTIGTPRPRQPPAQTPTNAAIDAENLRRLRLENAQHERDAAAGGGAQVNPETRGQARAKVAAVRSLRRQLERVERLFEERLGGQRSLMEYLPTEYNQEFDAAVQGMMPLVRQAFRVPGSGADTEREAVYLERVLPNRFSFDETNRQRIRQMREMLDDVEREYGPIAGIPTPQAAPRGLRVVARRPRPR